MDHHHHTFHLLKNKEIDELYFSFGLRAFAVGLVSIFIPLFLLDIGFDLTNIFLFYLITSITHVLLLLPSGIIASKIGFKHTIALSQPFLILTFLLLFLIKTYPIPLLLISITMGIYTTLFWVSFHSDFAKNSSNNSQGKEIAIVNIIGTTLSAIAPAIGGLILFYFNFSWLFFIAVIVLIISIIPLLITQDTKEPLDFSIKHIFKNRKKTHTIGYIGYGLYARSLPVFWPLILFGILGSYTALGFITTFLLIFSIIATIIIGKILDGEKKSIISKLLKISGIVWGLKLLVVTPITAYLADFFHGLLNPAYPLTIDLITYKNSKKKALEYVIYRETVIHSTIILVLMLMIFVQNLYFGLILAIIGSFILGEIFK